MSIFIVGSGRSGTTFLGETLEADGYGSSFESQYLIKCIQTFGDTINDEKTLKQYLQLVKSFRSIQQFNPDLDIAQFHARYPTINSQNAYAFPLEQIAQAFGHNRWIDKTPFYIKHIALIKEYFPNTKIVWCIRDGRDVCLSVLQKSWGPNTVKHAAIEWSEEMAAHYDDSELIKFRYEAFVTDYHNQLCALYQAIGFQPDVTGTIEKETMPNNFEKWRTRFSEDEKRIYEAIAFEQLQQMDYSTHFEVKPTIGAFESIRYDIEEKYKLWRHLFILNIIDPTRIRLNLMEPFVD